MEGIGKVHERKIMKDKENSINGHYKRDVILARRSIQKFNEMKSVSFNVFSDISILIKKRSKRPQNAGKGR